MKIKKPPHILVIHLKRFKYIEQLGRYKKLSYRVVFPLELKLSNTVEDADIEYSLFAVVVHVGSGPNHGHYVSLVKSHNHWLFFDDENVEMIDESAVQTFFGSAQEYSSNTDHGYILFYESIGASNNKSWEEGAFGFTSRYLNHLDWTYILFNLLLLFFLFPFVLQTMGRALKCPHLRWWWWWWWWLWQMYTWVTSMYSGWWKLTILVFFQNKRIKEQCIWFENFTETACIVHGWECSKSRNTIQLEIGWSNPRISEFVLTSL